MKVDVVNVIEIKEMNIILKTKKKIKKILLK